MNLHIRRKHCLSLVVAMVSLLPSLAQGESKKSNNPWRLKPSLGIQNESHYSFAKDMTPRLRANTYIDAGLHSTNLDLGLRFESLRQPLPGYEHAQGWGLPHLYAHLRYKGQELQLGDIYDQFGSGMVLRFYEDRAIGVDNALRGASLRLNLDKGISLKALAGQQRHFFDRGTKFYTQERGFVYGADTEVSFSEYIKGLRERNTSLVWGASFVTRDATSHQSIIKYDDPSKQLRFPSLVHAFATRLNYKRGSWDAYLEYAHKSEDPNATNDYTFGTGQILMATLTYSRGALSAFVGARRSEAFDFRSSQHERGFGLKINHLLPFNTQQSYALAGMNPYNTQPAGEWAWQGEIHYRLKRGSKLGGRYGTQLKLSGSYITGLDKASTKAEGAATLAGTTAHSKAFFATGDKYFYDLTLEMSRKISNSYSLSLLYTHQYYNRQVLEGYGGELYSHTLVYDAKHRLSKKLSLRTELQCRRRVQRDTWLYGAAELHINPSIILSIANELWLEEKEHYPYLSIATSFGSHRLQLGVGKTSSGMNCSGGVCRYMPETEGLYFSYNFNL